LLSLKSWTDKIVVEADEWDDGVGRTEAKIRVTRPGKGQTEQGQFLQTVSEGIHRVQAGV